MIELTNFHSWVLISLVFFTLQDFTSVALGSPIHRTKDFSHAEVARGRRIRGNRGDSDRLARYINEQRDLLTGAKTTEALVKRFVRFLRQAYPKQIAELTSREGSKPIPRRSLLQGMAGGMFSYKGRVSRPKIEKLSDKKMGCGCGGTDDMTTTDDAVEEINKFQLFFSDPPLCHPTTTMTQEDLATATDLCGHECQCHTEPPLTDNDREIYITTTKPTVKTTKATTTECGSSGQ